MATQKSQTTGFLPGDDPEILEANRRYQEALNKLTQSLDTRKNRMFDPVWLAAAQGFLAPGTPDFFESLGRVAKNVGEAQMAQEKENRDIAQMELDVAGRGLEMQRQRSLQSLAARQMQRQQPGEPSGALPGGQRGFQIAPPDPNRITGEQYYALAVAGGASPAEAMKGASQIDEKNMQVKEGGVFDPRSGMFYPNKYETVDYQIFGKTYKIPQGAALELDFLAGSGDEAKFTAAAERAIRNFQRPPAAQGPAAQPPSLPSAAALPAPPALAVPVAPAAGPSAPAPLPPVPNLQPSPSAQEPAGGVQRRVMESAREHLASMGATPAQVAPVAAQSTPQAAAPREAAAPAARPPAALPVAPQVAQAALAAVQPAAPAAVTPAAPPVVAQAARPADTNRMLSQQELEIQQATAKARAEADVKSEIENRAQISENAKKAREITATANVLRRMADAPDFSKMTGILNNDKISSGLAMLVRDGIGGRSISVGIPAIEDVMRNAGLNTSQQARFRTFLMYTAQMNLAAEQSMKGSTTERERLILGNATISPQDTKETVRVKADILNLKAQFDKRVANAFEDAKMTPKEFFRSDAYETMYGTYLENLTSIATGEKMRPSQGQRTSQGTAPPARQGAGQPGVSRARDTLNDLLNRRP
jgi:hypothetical protein